MHMEREGDHCFLKPWAEILMYLRANLDPELPGSQGKRGKRFSR